MNDPSFNVQQLVTASLFKDVELEFIEHLLRQCRVRDLTPGETITIGSETPITFYVVLEGELRSAEGRIYTPGNSAGEENLLYRDIHSYVLEAAEPSRLLVMPEDDFWRMVTLDQQLVRNLTRGRLSTESGHHWHISTRNWMLVGAALILLGILVTGAMRFLGLENEEVQRKSVASTDFDPDNEDLRFTVSTRPVDDWVQIKGTVQPVRWTDATAALSSRITQVYFEFGDLVSVGQPLLELATDQQESRRREAETRLINSEQGLRQLQAWSNGPEVRRAQRDLLRAKDDKTLAENDLEDAKRLYERGIISEQELQNANSQLERRRMEETNARESLDAVLARGDEAALRVAQLQLANAQQELQAIEQEIASARILSPATGLIFPYTDSAAAKEEASIAPLSVGAPVQLNQGLFAIADMDGISLEADVAEVDMLALAKGQPARVRFDSLSELELEGQIESVAGRGTKREYQGATFRVRVVVPEITELQRSQLRIGMAASALVLTFHNDAAMVIPFAAVTFENGRYVVHRLEGSEARVVPIQIRSTQVDGIEVSTGISPGDQLLLSGATSYGR